MIPLVASSFGSSRRSHRLTERALSHEIIAQRETLPLSSVDQHSRQIGSDAARLVLEALKSKVVPKPEVILLPPELVVRASTQRKLAKSHPDEKMRRLAGAASDGESFVASTSRIIVHRATFFGSE